MKPADIERLHALYAESRQELFTYALSITRNREVAEDAVHAVFERLLRSDRLPAELRPFVFRAVRNAAYDTLRRDRVRTDSVFVLAASADDADVVQDALGAADLQTLLDQLTPDERETIVLKTYGGLTFHEIAEVRGQPLPTVASWHRRGLERLRTLLAKER